jgi:hypothetical protein
MPKVQTVLVRSETGHLECLWEVPPSGIVVRVQLVEGMFDVSAEAGEVHSLILRQIEEALTTELKISRTNGEKFQSMDRYSPPPGR